MGYLVTGIDPVDKTRSKIYLNDEFAFVLYKGELRSLKIEIEGELSDSDYEKVFTEILPKRAKLRCMNLLKSRPYTESTLRDKLRQGLYPEEIIDIALAYVKSFGYVDDRRYAAEYFQSMAPKKSRKQIRFDLIQKGISSEIIDDVMAEAEQEDDLPDEKELIRKLLKKRHFNADEADYEEIQKTVAFLYRKGFSSEKIREVLSEE